MMKRNNEKKNDGVDTGELLYTKRVLKCMSLEQLLSVETKNRNSKVLDIIGDKLARVAFLKKIEDKRWKREIFKYLRFCEFDPDRVIQIKEERAVGLFIVLKGTVKEYRKIVPNKRKHNILDDDILADEEQIDSKIDSSVDLSPRKKNILKKKISVFVKENRLNLLKRRSRVRKKDSIIVLKSAMAHSKNSILSRIGQNRYSLDHIKSPLFNNQFKKKSKFFNLEFINSRGIKFNSKDKFYRTVWELNKIIKKGEPMGINDLLKTKKFSYTYTTGDSGAQLLFIPIENFNSLLENQLRAKNTEMKLLMEKDILTGINNKGLFDQLVYDFRDVEYKKGAFVYRKGDYSKFIYILLEGSVEIIEYIPPEKNLADVFEVGRNLLHRVKDRNQEVLKNLERKTIVFLKKNFKQAKRVTVYNVGSKEIFGEIECLEPPEEISYNFEIPNLDDLDSSGSSSDELKSNKVAKNYKKHYNKRNFSAVVTSREAKILRIPVDTLRLRFHVYKDLYRFIINRIEKKRQVYKAKLTNLFKDLKRKKFIYQRDSYKNQTFTAKKLNKKYSYYRDRIKSLNFKNDNEEKAEYTEDDLMYCLTQLKVSLRLSLERQKLNRFKKYYQAIKDSTKRKIELRKIRLQSGKFTQKNREKIEKVFEEMSNDMSIAKGRRPKYFIKGNLCMKKPFSEAKNKRSKSLSGNFFGLGGANWFDSEDKLKIKASHGRKSSASFLLSRKPKRTPTCSTDLNSKAFCVKSDIKILTSKSKKNLKSSSMINFHTIINNFEKNNFSLNSEINLKPSSEANLFDEKDQITNFELNQRASKKLRNMLNFRKSGMGTTSRVGLGRAQKFNTEF